MKQKTLGWMKLFRAHTAILETPLAVLGAAIGLGTVWHTDIIGWVLFGVLYHFAGYGMNSYVDWAKGFDKDDPNKQDHPLNTGVLSQREAKTGVGASLIALILVAEYMGNFSQVAHTFVIVMLLLGVTYNFFGKYIRAKFIPIALVHTMVFIYPLAVYKPNFMLVGIALSTGFFIHHTYQIMISGDIKDLKCDEASLLKTLGAEVVYDIEGNEILDMSNDAQVLAFMLAIVEIGLAVSALFLFGSTPLSIAMVILLSGWMMLESDKVVRNGPYKRETRVSAMSRKELSGIWLMCASAIPVIGIRGFGVIILVSMAYFLPVSKIMWGNWVKPEV